MIRRISVGAGLGVLAAALFGRRASKDQAAADRWNRSRIARGLTVGGRTVAVRAPEKVGKRGDKGRWQWGWAQTARRGRRR